METCTRSPERNDAKMFGASRRIREASGISCQMDQLPSFRSVVASFHRPEKEGRQMSRIKTSRRAHHILKRRLQAWVAQGIAWHCSKVNFLFYFTNVSQSGHFCAPFHAKWRSLLSVSKNYHSTQSGGLSCQVSKNDHSTQSGGLCCQ